LSLISLFSDIAGFSFIIADSVFDFRRYFRLLIRGCALPMFIISLRHWLITSLLPSPPISCRCFRQFSTPLRCPLSVFDSFSFSRLPLLFSTLFIDYLFMIAASFHADIMPVMTDAMAEPRFSLLMIFTLLARYARKLCAEAQRRRAQIARRQCAWCNAAAPLTRLLLILFLPPLSRRHAAFSPRFAFSFFFAAITP